MRSAWRVQLSRWQLLRSVSAWRVRLTMALGEVMHTFAASTTMHGVPKVSIVSSYIFATCTHKKTKGASLAQEKELNWTIINLWGAI